MKFRFSLSYRELEEMMDMREASIDHSTLARWVNRFSSLIESTVRRRKKPVNGSWRMDETYIKSNGKWIYLYRAVDKSETELKVFFEKQKKDSPVTALTAHKEMVSEWAKLGSQASTIYVRLRRNFEYTGSYYSVQRFVKSVKADNVLPDLTTPLHFESGEAVQVDFGHGPKLLDTRTRRVKQTYYFVMMRC